MGIIAGANPPEGVFLMQEGREPDDPRFPGLTMHPWTAISLDGGDTRGNAVATLRSQIVLPDEFRKKVNRALTPGTILVSTKRSSNANTRSGKDFTIMKPQEKR